MKIQIQNQILYIGITVVIITVLSWLIVSGYLLFQILGGSPYSTEWKLIDDKMAGVSSANGDIIFSVYCPNDSYGIMIDFPNDTPVGNWISVRWGDQEYSSRYNLHNDGDVLMSWDYVRTGDKGLSVFSRHATSPTLYVLKRNLERYHTMEIAIDTEERPFFYDTINLNGAAGIINRLECV